MKRLVFGAALTACALVAVPAAAVTDASAALNSIVTDLLGPAARNATEAVNLAASDPNHACQMAKDATSQLLLAQRRMNALDKQMTAEGQDSAKLAPVEAKLSAAIPQYENLTRSVCSGEVAKVQSDPATHDLTVKVGGYMKAFADDLTGADAALAAGDQTKACAFTRDGNTQIDGLSTYMSGMRSSRTWSPDDIQGFDLLDKRISAFRAGLTKRLAACPTP